MSWLIQFNANTYYAGQKEFEVGYGLEPAYTSERDQAMSFETKQQAQDEKQKYELIGHIIPE